MLANVTSNRKDERPVNAILNYLYALLEAEAIVACYVVGLDPGLGLVHADTKARASFALDLIEPVRPEVDRSCWTGLLQRRTFRKDEFTETAHGPCRLLAPLTHELAETLPLWSRAVAPYAEHATHVLGQAMVGKYEPVTPLTARRQRAANVEARAKSALARGCPATPRARQRADGVASNERWCVDCGAQVLMRATSAARAASPRTRGKPLRSEADVHRRSRRASTPSRSGTE